MICCCVGWFLLGCFCLLRIWVIWVHVRLNIWVIGLCICFLFPWHNDMGLIICVRGVTRKLSIEYRCLIYCYLVLYWVLITREDLQIHDTFLYPLYTARSLWEQGSPLIRFSITNNNYAAQSIMIKQKHHSKTQRCNVNQLTPPAPSSPVKTETIKTICIWCENSRRTTERDISNIGEWVYRECS